MSAIHPSSRIHPSRQLRTTTSQAPAHAIPVRPFRLRVGDVVVIEAERMGLRRLGRRKLLMMAGVTSVIAEGDYAYVELACTADEQLFVVGFYLGRDGRKRAGEKRDDMLPQVLRPEGRWAVVEEDGKLVTGKNAVAGGVTVEEYDEVSGLGTLLSWVEGPKERREIAEMLPKGGAWRGAIWELGGFHLEEEYHVTCSPDLQTSRDMMEFVERLDTWAAAKATRMGLHEAQVTDPSPDPSPVPTPDPS